MRELTKVEYWDQGYRAREAIGQLAFDWRNHVNTQIAAKIEEIGLPGKSVLEIGAGDSAWLPYLARKYPAARCAGLDYSAAGCSRLADRLAAAGSLREVGIHQEDMFSTHSKLHGKFDLVLSFGVVEHFTELAEALQAKRRYLKPGGTMFSLIPNMAGSIGHLTRFFNRRIFDIHNPHDRESFIAGHRNAGLTMVACDYLGSSNFGVLSSCFEQRRGMSWHAYVLLSRASKAVMLAESRLGRFPTSRMFSPYIYAIARNG